MAHALYPSPWTPYPDPDNKLSRSYTLTVRRQLPPHLARKVFEAYWDTEREIFVVRFVDDTHIETSTLVGDAVVALIALHAP